MGTAFVKSAIDFLSLFRTDTAITNKKVTIEETALGALVANEMRLRGPNFKVYFPRAYFLSMTGNRQMKTPSSRS